MSTDHDCDLPPSEMTLEMLVSALTPLTTEVIIPSIEAKVISVEIADVRLPNGDMGPAVVVKFRVATGGDAAAWDSFSEDEKPPSVVGEMHLNLQQVIDDYGTDPEEVLSEVAELIADHAGLHVIELAAELRR